jgi:hypothetical protein
VKLTEAFLNLCSKHHQPRGIASPRSADNSKITLTSPDRFSAPKNSERSMSAAVGRGAAATYEKGIAAKRHPIWYEVPSLCHTAESETTRQPGTVESLSPTRPAQHSKQPVRDGIAQAHRVLPSTWARGQY